MEKQKTEDKSTKTKAGDIFGISDKKADELLKQMQHAEIDTKTISEMFKELGLPKGNEDIFLAFIFGKFVARNDLKGENSLAKLMSM